MDYPFNVRLTPGREAGSCLLPLAGRQVDEGPVVGVPHLGVDVVLEAVQALLMGRHHLFVRRLAGDKNSVSQKFI